MARLDHDSIAIAESYARSILDLSEEAGNSDDVLLEFGEFVSMMETEKDFGGFMVNPAVDLDDRRKVLEKHFRGRFCELLVNALQIINLKGRCEIIPLIFERYRLALEERRNEVEVYVTSAVEMDDDAREGIRQAAGKVSGRWARLVEKVDPSLIGGLVVQIGDEKIDASVIRRLQRLRGLLHDRASQEIHSGKDYFERVEA